MKKNSILLICLFSSLAIFAQNEQKDGDDMAAAGNYSGAAMMYRRCMESNPQCRLKLFKLIYDGKIDSQSTDELYQLINPLARQGNAEAQYYLGMLYKQGIGGVRQDNTEASTWIQRSADQGYAYARNELAAVRTNEAPTRIIAGENKANPSQNNYPVNRNDKVNQGATSWSGTLFVTGGICIAGGIAASLLTPKTYTDYGNGTIVEGKEYNLVYAAAGIVAGSVCIGSGISLKKKEKARSLAYRNDYAYLNIIATGNGAGLRLTF